MIPYLRDMRPLIVRLESSEWISSHLPYNSPAITIPYNRWPRTCHEIVAAIHMATTSIEEDEVKEAINDAAKNTEKILGETPIAIIVAEAEDDNPILILIGIKKNIVCTNYCRGEYRYALC